LQFEEKKKDKEKKKKEGKKEKDKKKKRKKRREAMVGTWSSCANIVSSKLTQAYRPNLPSPAGWEVCKVRGKLEIRRIRGGLI
jgi:hypothetical protein